MTIKRIAGPAYLAAAAANIYTPPNAAVYIVISQIHVANKTAGAADFSLYIGATGGSAAGTEVVFEESVQPNDHKDLFFSPGLRLDSTDFLSGLASAASTLTIMVMGSYEAA